MEHVRVIPRQFHVGSIGSLDMKIHVDIRDGVEDVGFREHMCLSKWCERLDTGRSHTGAT